jgi:hypothetical protein
MFSPGQYRCLDFRLSKRAVLSRPVYVLRNVTESTLPPAPPLQAISIVMNDEITRILEKYNRFI